MLGGACFFNCKIPENRSMESYRLQLGLGTLIYYTTECVSVKVIRGYRFISALTQQKKKEKNTDVL